MKERCDPVDDSSIHVIQLPGRCCALTLVIPATKMSVYLGIVLRLSCTFNWNTHELCLPSIDE